MRSNFTKRIRLSWSRSVDGAQVGPSVSAHKSSISATERRRAATVEGLRVISAATRWASFLGPRTLRLTCTGRPFSSLPAKPLTPQTPRRRFRIVATDSNGRVVGMK